MRFLKTGFVIVATAVAAAGSNAQAVISPGGQQARVAELQSRLGLAQLATLSRLAETRDRYAVAHASSSARVGLAQLESTLALRSMESAARVARVRSGASLAGLRSLEALNIPEAWDAQDPADSLYRAARRALNDRSYRAAIRMYSEIRANHPSSTYVGDSYYWQAQALFRQGGGADMDQAVELLQAQMNRFPDAPTAEDARSLLVRIQAQQAQRGNSQAAIAVTRSASSECEDEEDGLRSAALSALLQMDSERAAPILREVLRDRDECSVELREQAIFLLAQHPDPETVELLLDLAHRNPDPSERVREAAVFWLSQVDSEEALDALLSILESGTAGEGIQERAIFAISQHDSDRVSRILRDYAERSDVPTELRRNAIHWIGQRPGSAAFLRSLYTSVNDREIREQVLFAVSQSRTEESRAWLLERALDTSEDTEVRKNALFWAGQTGAPTADVLRVYRTAEDVELREQAIFVLSQTRSTEAVDAMMDIARNEETRELKERAIFWLGQSRDPRVAEFLLELIRGG